MKAFAQAEAAKAAAPRVEAMVCSDSVTERCACDESLRLRESCDDCGAPSDHNHADWCPQAAPFACPGCYAGPEDTCADWCAAAAQELLAETDDAGDVHGYT